MARLTNKTTKRSVKYRHEKREQIHDRERNEQLRQQAEAKVLKLTEFVTANDLAQMMDIPVNSVDSYYMLDRKTGYIRVGKFAKNTYQEFLDALVKLRMQGADKMVIDLRGNSGGYMDQAILMANEFLPEGSSIVATHGRLDEMEGEITADGTGAFQEAELIVLLDEFSASASEIFAGAIQDNDRGLILGRRSFGKGLVQRQIDLPDASALRLTTARYYTPSGRDIQKPYDKGNQSKYAHDILDRLSSGELMHQDSIKYVDSLRVNTLRLKRPIYGGGGISPDVFVPLDTTDYTKYYRDVMAKGDINKYCIRYVDTHRDRIKKKYPDDSQFIANFQVTDDMLDELYAMAEKDGVKPDPKEAEQSRKLFTTVLKGLIGRDIYDNPTYFKVYNQYDPIFKEAYRLINSPDYDKKLSAPN